MRNQSRLPNFKYASTEPQANKIGKSQFWKTFPERKMSITKWKTVENRYQQSAVIHCTDSC